MCDQWSRARGLVNTLMLMCGFEIKGFSVNGEEKQVVAVGNRGMGIHFGCSVMCMLLRLDGKWF